MPKNRLAEPRTLDDMLLYVLWQLQSTARRQVVQLCESEFGVTRREWRMLAQLAQAGPLASSALAERAGLDRAQTSRAIGSLVAKQLVARTPRSANRREVLLQLTQQGEALYAALLPRVAAVNKELLSVLNCREIDVLDEFLQRLQAQAHRMADARP